MQKKHILISIAGGLLAGFLNGLFGSGGGTVIVPFLEYCMHQDAHKAHATAILIIFFLTIVSLIFYGTRQSLDYSLALYLSVGGIIGGLVGANFLKKLSGKTLKKIFGAFMMIVAIRMVVTAW